MSTPDERAGAQLWAMAQLALPMAVRVAATLRLADHIAAGHRTAPELAALTRTDPDALARLLRFLAARDLLVAEPDGGYGLTRLGEALRDDHPAAVRGWLDIDGAGRGELAFVHLLHSVRTGEAAFPLLFGRSFWDDLNNEPERSGSFHGLLGGQEPVWSRAAVSTGYDWGRLGHVVDVGGGSGVAVTELLTAYPSLRGTVFDRPDMAETARIALAAAGVADRADVVTGDFFESVPAGAGGYVLSLVLHNWPDREARRILRSCAVAAGAAGSVFVVENVGGDGASPPRGMDLRMLTLTAGKERGVAEIGELAAQVGLAVKAVHRARHLSIIELRAAP
jgi:hypothetical protein